MYKDYFQYCEECERSNIEPLTYAEWVEADALMG